MYFDKPQSSATWSYKMRFKGKSKTNFFSFRLTFFMRAHLIHHFKGKIEFKKSENKRKTVASFKTIFCNSLEIVTLTYAFLAESFQSELKLYSFICKTIFLARSHWQEKVFIKLFLLLFTGSSNCNFYCI